MYRHFPCVHSLNANYVNISVRFLKLRNDETNLSVSPRDQLVSVAQANAKMPNCHYFCFRVIQILKYHTVYNNVSPASKKKSDT